jgi:hypothetical protein
MKQVSLLTVALGGVLCCTVSRANITSINYADDGDGAINCTPYTWTGSQASWTCPVNGDQFWGPGQVVGTITTDSATDPKLTLDDQIVNDSGFSWTSYDVNVYLSQSFTLSAVDVTLPPDWTVSSFAQPTLVNSPLGAYEAQMVFSSGTPVQVGQELDFNYSISFTGATSYSFTEEVIPVPEPAIFALVPVGALLWGGFVAGLRRKRI